MDLIDSKQLRAVEIRSPRYGTGYRIGGRLVLTAAHLIPDGKGSRCEVRSWCKNDDGEWEEDWTKKNAEVVWTGLPKGKSAIEAPSYDIALILLPEDVKKLEPVVFGKLGSEQIPFTIYGFPRWAWTLHEHGSRTGGRHIDGLIYTNDIPSQKGLFVLEPYRKPERPNTSETSAWEGISGAAVVCEDLVVGVQLLHQNPNRSSSLEAVLLSKFYNNHDFIKILRKQKVHLEVREVQRNKSIQIENQSIELWEFIKDYKSVTSWAVKVAVFVPLADIVMNIGPPWPSHIQVSVITCFFEFIVVMYFFEFWKNKKIKVNHIRKVLKLSIFLLVTSCMAYISLSSSFILDPFNDGGRVIVGYKYLKIVEEIIIAYPELNKVTELFAQFHEEEKIYTSFSLTIMRIILLSVWGVVWSAFGATISSFTALQWRR